MSSAGGTALKCRVITDPEHALGFRLAGVQVHQARTAAEAEAHLKDLVAEGECGLLLIDRRLLDGISEPRRRELERRGLPLVVPLPLSGRWRPRERGLDDLLRLIRRAVGYQMRIRR